MEALVFIFLVIIILMINSLKKKVMGKLTFLEKEMSILKKQLVEMPVAKDTDKKTLGVIQEVKPQTTSAPALPADNKPPVPPVVVQTEKVFTPPPRKAAPVPKVEKPGFFERHPDLEKFIGENLVSKIGIAILVLAIGFFVKYAIDNNWIGPVGRVAIGVICGGILVGVAHYLRNNYKAFSSVLVGGGLAIFYFTIALAYHQFHLFSQTLSFVIMVVITAFAVVLSTLYNRQELAVIALVGGFSTPFMVSSGNGNYHILFVYLLILNAGLLVIALKKSWRLLNLLAFLFTALLFSIWLISMDGKQPTLVYRNGFLYATLFYLLFFVINIAHNIREQKKFIASDFSILLANTGLYFAAGLYCLTAMEAFSSRGFFCLILGVFNLGISYLLFRKNKVDANILYLLIGITLTFISLTAPIQLRGNHITLFWASEAVLLYWLFQKSKIRVIQIASLLVWICMLLSLIIDIGQVYRNNTRSLAVIFNKGFITTLFAAASTYLLFILRIRDVASSSWTFSGVIPGKNIYRLTALILLYATGFFEINHQFAYHYPNTGLNGLYLIFYTMAFLLAITIVASRVTSLQISKKTITRLLMAGVLLYLLQLPYSFGVQRTLLLEHQHGVHFIFHWLTALIAMVMIFRLIQFYRLMVQKRTEWITWLICAVALVVITAEVHLLTNAVFYSDTASLGNIQRVFIKSGWPILWGLASFSFMWLGMRYKFRLLRIISLTLFTITLIKLFTYDIVNIPVGGKIAAFFSLGVLLLVVSFMYQRLKKIIIDEEAVTK